LDEVAGTGKRMNDRPPTPMVKFTEEESRMDTGLLEYVTTSTTLSWEPVLS
jgi:hypothetical protein